MKPFEEELMKIEVEKILDVATGRGDFILALKESLGGYGSFIGIDVKGGPSWQGEEFDPKWVTFIEMDAAELKFPDEEFDLVAISNSLHHMPNPEKTLAEMMRVLKPGGWFVFKEMFTDGQTEIQQTHTMLHQWCGRIDTEAGISHKSPYLKKELAAFLIATGIEGWQYYEDSDLTQDPFDPETLKEMDELIDRYKEKTCRDELKEEGEALRSRVKMVGFQLATELFAIGRKS